VAQRANPRHNPNKRRVAAQVINRPARRARICAVQYEMRKVRNWEELCEQVEYFVDTANLYDSHLVIQQRQVIFPGEVLWSRI
jgi:hypothetical protein